jgi:hypothetical protein
MSQPNSDLANSKGQDTEDDLRNQLQAVMLRLKRREPFDATYKRLLMNGAVTPRRPVLPKDKTYKPIGSNLRARVEKFLEQTQGKDPFDRIAQRQPLEEEQMRAALTLREAKKHEQQALLDVTLSALPRRNGMDAVTRRRYLEGIVLGLQEMGEKPIVRSRAPTPSMMPPTDQARQKAELDMQMAQARAREEARLQREREERTKREEELKRKARADTPQAKLFQVIYPIFKELWDMEFPQLSGTNPFRIVIDRENCASCGAPDYFEIIDKPMNLTYIQEKVNKMEYSSFQSFCQDVDLMISNAIKYNSDPSNPYRIAAEELKMKYIKTRNRIVKNFKAQQQAAAKK